MLDIILITVGVLGLTIATLSDIKTKEIPDWLSYSLIAAGLAIRLLHSLIYQDFLPLAYVVIAFIMVFSFSHILYYTKQWGGGDAKMLMALSTIFATRPSYLPETDIPFLFILIANILFIGAIYGLIYGIVLAIKMRKKFKEEIKSLIKQHKTRKLAVYSFVGSILFIIFSVLSKEMLIKLTSSAVAIILPSYFILWICTKTIENISMYKRRAIQNLRIGDWLAANIIYKGELILKSNPEGLTKLDIATLKQNKIKSVIVKEGIPFIPPFLIATVLTLIVNKFLFLI